MDFAALELWLNAHAELIIVVIALTSFVESLALVGIVVPGIALLFAAGSAAGSTEIPLLWVLSAAFLGSVAGDGLSFLLGYHYHEWIRRVPPFKTHPQWISRGEDFFHKYGMMGIVLGRFVGPLRPVMPLVAGALQMRPVYFFTINILSALAWAPFYLMPGYLVGASLNNDNALSGRHVVFLLSLLFSGWIIAQLLWWAHQNIYLRRNKLQLALTVALLGGSLFVLLSQLMQFPPLILINQQFALWALSLRHPWLDPFFIGLTQLGYFAPMTVWAVLVAIALGLQRNYYCLALWSVSVTISGLALRGFKETFAWERPQLIQQLPESYAYPSGHTVSILVFFGSLAILLLPGIPSRRQKAFLSGIGITVALMAGSRLYLTVHWLTDILGGLLLGGALLAVLYTMVLKKPFRIVKPKPVIAASIIAWVIGLGYWALPHLHAQEKAYAPIHKINANQP